MIALNSIQDTRRIAEEIIEGALNKAAPCMIALEGEIGVGKSELVRQSLRSLGYDGPVQSPTFTIYNQYHIGDIVIVHADFYRLGDPDDLLMIGWDELVEDANIVFVEWASVVHLVVDLEVSMMQDGKTRVVNIKK